MKGFFHANVNGRGEHVSFLMQRRVVVVFMGSWFVRVWRQFRTLRKYGTRVWRSCILETFRPSSTHWMNNLLHNLIEEWWELMNIQFRWWEFGRAASGTWNHTRHETCKMTVGQCNQISFEGPALTCFINDTLSMLSESDLIKQSVTTNLKNQLCCWIFKAIFDNWRVLWELIEKVFRD